jgi:hypothetical protein
MSSFSVELQAHNFKDHRPNAGHWSRNRMGTSGELIRLINYVDDITTTLRRISAFVPAMENDERKRLAESLRAAGTNLNALVAQVEKGRP